MSFEDMISHFTSINVCMTRIPGLNNQPWNEVRRKFMFEYSNSSSASSDGANKKDYTITSPSYLLRLNEASTIIASVHQQDTRCENSLPYIDIGVNILQCDSTTGKFSLITGSSASTERQNQTKEILLQPGEYIIIPTTTGCKLKQYVDTLEAKKANGTTTINRIPLTKTLSSGEVIFTDEVINAYNELFSRIDTDSDGYITKKEMDLYTLKTENACIDEEAYKWIVENFETSNNDASNTNELTLSLSAFLRAQLYVFQRCGCDEEKLYKELTLLGYNEELKLEKCRSMVLSIHSTSSNYTIDTLPYDINAVDEAEELLVVREGNVRVLDNGNIKLYTLRSVGSTGVSIMIENLHVSKKLIFEVDCSNSKNVVSHRGVMLYKATIIPGEKVIMHHLMPADPEVRAWSWSYSASFLFDH
jgi:Ca2+-binding EF-hand superfamily protein